MVPYSLSSIGNCLQEGVYILVRKQYLLHPPPPKKKDSFSPFATRRFSSPIYFPAIIFFIFPTWGKGYFPIIDPCLQVTYRDMRISVYKHYNGASTASDVYGYCSSQMFLPPGPLRILCKIHNFPRQFLPYILSVFV